MAAPADRFLWAFNKLDIQPGDHILEIGCGSGIFARLIANRLKQGKLIAIDRSASMIAKAIRKNQRDKRTGEIVFIETDFMQYDWSGKVFDKVIAFNVGFFLKKDIAEIQLLKSILNPNGSLYVFYQPPYFVDISFTHPIKELLVVGGFHIKNESQANLSNGTVFCIVATH
jgi:SAM-dependent methyltransferase